MAYRKTLPKGMYGTGYGSRSLFGRRIPASMMSADDAQMERMMGMQQLMRGESGVPSNIGEGLAQLGQAIAGRMRLSRANEALQAQQAAGSSLFNSLPLAGAGGGDAGAPPPQPAMQASVAPAGDIKSGIVSSAAALGISPADLATAISYETKGTFNPTEAGPHTQWGTHRGLIQFGEPQAKKYGVDWNNPVGSQLGADGAVVKYLRDAGVKPGMGMMDIYSAINAGRVGRYNASDANNGGAPGTVADKVNTQMAGHRAKALALLGGAWGYQPASAAPPTAIADVAQTAPQMGAPGPTAPQQVAASSVVQLPSAAGPGNLTASQRMLLQQADRNPGSMANPERIPAQIAAGQFGGPAGSGGTGPGGFLSMLFGRPQGMAPQSPVSPAPMSQDFGIQQTPLPITQATQGAQVPAAMPSAPQVAAVPQMPTVQPPDMTKLRQLQQAIADPAFQFMPPAQQQIVLGELERLQQQSDPIYQAETNAKLAEGYYKIHPDQLPMNAHDKQALELDQKKFDWERNKPTVVGNDSRLVGPDGKVIIGADPNAASKLPSSVQEYQYAQSQGFKGTFQDWEASKKGGMSLSVDPATGEVTFQQGGNIKPLTEAQGKDAVFATRAGGALPTLEKYGNALASPTAAFGSSFPLIGNYLKPEDYQRAEQAGNEFLTAILRKDSGAVIGKEELSSYGNTYLPRPGDSAAVLEQKRVARQRALDALKSGMTPQAILAQEQALKKTAPQQNSNKSGDSTKQYPGAPAIGTVEDGYRYVGGDPKDIDAWVEVK